MKEVKWGIIGAGDVCEKKSAPAMQLIPNSSVVAVMRRNPAKVKDFAIRHKIPFYTTDINEILNHADVNAVYIATPPESHLKLSLKVAEAGLPCYVEKPMAINYIACTQMIDAFKNANLPLFVAYYRRRLPNFLKIKELIDNKVIGDVRSVNIRMFKTIENNLIAESEENWRVNPKISGGGYFHDLASHQLDFLDYLFGPVIRAYGYSKNQSGTYKADDIVSGIFEFNNGVMGNGMWCFNSSNNAEEEMTTIIGSKGYIKYASFGNSDVHLFVDNEKPQTFKFTYPEHIQQYLIETIVDELLGDGECPSKGESAARTSWVIDEIIRHK